MQYIRIYRAIPGYLWFYRAILCYFYQIRSIKVQVETEESKLRVVLKEMEFSIKLAGWVLDDPVFH